MVVGLSRASRVGRKAASEAAERLAHLEDGWPVFGDMAEHRVDQLAELPGCLHRSAPAVGHSPSLDWAWSVVRVLDSPPTGGGDEQGGAECVDVGFRCRLGFPRGEHAARDLRRLVVDEAAAEREVVALGHVSVPGKGEVDEMRLFWPDDEVGGLYAAQDQARSAVDITPRVLSMLSMREAFAHATLGNTDSTHRAIGEAHRHFERIRVSDPDTSWVTYFDETKLIVDTGIAHGRLGEAATAEPLIADALRREARTNQRGRAFHSFWLARTQLDQGKLDQACDTATQALGPASAVASERVSGHLRESYDQLAPHRQEPIALAFEARLRALLPPVSGSLRP